MTGNRRPIPEIRDRLRKIADETGIDELRDLADEAYRKAPVKRAKTQSDTLTPELAEKIREYAALNPGMLQRDIGQHFNVNSGRVSEALNYKQ